MIQVRGEIDTIPDKYFQVRRRLGEHTLYAASPHTVSQSRTLNQPSHNSCSRRGSNIEKTFDVGSQHGTRELECAFPLNLQRPLHSDRFTDSCYSETYHLERWQLISNKLIHLHHVLDPELGRQWVVQEFLVWVVQEVRLDRHLTQTQKQDLSQTDKIVMTRINNEFGKLLRPPAKRF